MRKICVCLMAGGVGSRFWPLSRETFPKQFIDINGKGSSLLSQTVQRFMAMGIDPEAIWIVSSNKYKDLIKAQIPEIPDSRIIGEPSRKNTAPAALLGTMAIKRVYPDSLVIMSPVDHHIGQEKVFADIMRQATDYVHDNEVLMTIGIQPTEPHTGYGYIKYSKQDAAPFKVDQFLEKPDLSRAKTFFADGNYLWNAGIFIWQTQWMLDLYAKLAPKIYALFQATLQWDGQAVDQSSLTAAYNQVEDISIDYKILEHCQDVYTIPGDFGWSDLGSWKAVYDLLPKNEDQSVALNSKLESYDSKGNLVFTNGKVVILKGLEDFMVIEDENVLMICPKQDDQAVKQYRSDTIQNFGDEFA